MEPRHCLQIRLYLGMFKYEETGGTLRCFFPGELNSDICGQIEPQLADLVAIQLKKNPELKLVFDLEGASYICSAFLRLCLYHCKFVGTRKFSVVNTSDEIRKVFTIAGFTEMMNIT